MKFVTKWKDSNGDYRSEELVLLGNAHTWVPQPPIPFGDITREVTVPKQEGECVEWSEGSYLEPDTLHGLKYLEAIKKALKEE